MSIGATKEYSFGEIAAIHGVSHGTVRNLFRYEPDVRRVGKPGSRRPVYSVPANVYERVMLRISNPPRTPPRR
jgi:hypothetical protein